MLTRVADRDQMATHGDLCVQMIDHLVEDDIVRDAVWDYMI